MKSSPLAVALLGCVATGFASLGACGGATPSDLLTPVEQGEDASTDSGHGGGSHEAGHGGSSSGDDANGDEPMSCATQCTSGCCANGQCTPGDVDTACGLQGAACQDCTAGGNVCLNGSCFAGSSSSSSSSSSSGGACDALICPICALGAASCCNAAGNCGCVAFGTACF
jgi:hypothetical protein